MSDIWMEDKQLSLVWDILHVKRNSSLLETSRLHQFLYINQVLFSH